ncbi:uncharacterized protein LOC122078552 [Macadamia integrifolia]|uniref:uncharacterized protein LOC122078552 n=1 Tax=Macadamia integrifolia TaxID=60698 RepID=UPI001C4E382D|nr:uncharacterized protein LOC122078552 [Macadamia integrifolia]
MLVGLWTYHFICSILVADYLHFRFPFGYCSRLVVVASIEIYLFCMGTGSCSWVLSVILCCWVLFLSGVNPGDNLNGARKVRGVNLGGCQDGWLWKEGLNLLCLIVSTMEICLDI